MKRILFIVLLFIVSTVVKAQYPITQFLGSDSAMVKSRGGLQGRFAPIPFTDTATANLSRIRQYPGALIYTSGVDKYWYRNSGATGWIEFTSSGGSTVNIYNSDGQLTGDRSLNGLGYKLTFDELLGFELNSTDSLIRLNYTRSGKGSIIDIGDAIKINPNLGNLLIDTLNTTQDTTTYKPIVIDPITGRVLQSSYWYGGTGGSSGGISQLGAGWGLDIVNDSTYRVDSSLVSTKYQSEKTRDSILAIISGISGATAGGSNRNLQINNAGTFSGSDSLRFLAGYLDINGYINLPNSTTSIPLLKVNSNRWLHNYGPTDFLNVGLGYNAGSLSTSDYNKGNVSIGSEAGAINKSFGQVFIGYQAGKLFTGGDSSVDGGNVFIGYLSGSAATGGERSVGIGRETLKSMQTGAYSNVAIGKAIFSNLTTGYANTSVGSATQNTTGYYNSYFGANVAILGTTAYQNTISGGAAGQNLATGYQNAIYGYAAGSSISDGYGNSFFGHRSGYLNVSGNNNIFLGNWAGAYYTNPTSRLSIQSGASGGMSTATIMGDLSTRKVGINKTENASLTYNLEVGGTIAASTIPFTASLNDTLVYWNPTSGQFERRLSGGGGSSDGYVDGGSVTDNILTLTQTGAADVDVYLPPSYLQNPISIDSLLFHINDSVTRVKAVSILAGSDAVTVTPTRNDSINTFEIDVVPANLAGIPQSGVTGLTDSIAALRSDIGTGGGSGTVTSVATNNGSGITGGTITTSGTLALDTAGVIATRLQVQHRIDSLNVALRAKYDSSYKAISLLNDSTVVFQKFDGGEDTLQFTGYNAGSGFDSTYMTARIDSIIANYISGSGTTDYVPIFTNTRILGNSGLYKNAAGNLVIGSTTSYSQKLAVPGSIYTDSLILGITPSTVGFFGAPSSNYSGTLGSSNFRVGGGKIYGPTYSSTSYVELLYRGFKLVYPVSNNASFNVFEIQSGTFIHNSGPYTNKMMYVPMDIGDTSLATFYGLHLPITDNSPSVANTIYGIYSDVSLGTNTSATRYSGIYLGGNFGIGTATPQKKFHSVGTARLESLGTASIDTTTYKPMGISSSGDVIPMASWDVSGAGGGGTDNSWDYFENFYSNVANLYSIYVSGTGAAQYQSSEPAASGAYNAGYGWLTLLTGTTSTGYAGIRTGSNNSTRFRSGNSTALTFQYDNIVFDDLSDGTDTYIARIGSMPYGTNAEAASGIYFTYSSADSSGVWVCCVANSSSRTRVASAVTVAAGTPYDLKYVVQSGSVDFYINGTLVTTIATNFPDGVAIQPFYAMIVKTAGTTTRNMSIDNFKMKAR